MVSADDGAASHQLVGSLARLPTSDLVRFTLQKPDVARVFFSSLHLLAVEAVSSPLPDAKASQRARGHVDILTRLIERGDPSLARKFVPTQGSLLDLAAAAPQESKSVVASILERLLDATSVNEIVGSLSSQLASIVSAGDRQHDAATSSVVRTLARLSTTFLLVCPRRLLKGNIAVLQTWLQTCCQIYDRILPQTARSLAGNAASNFNEPDLSNLGAQSWQLDWLTCRVDLLSLVSALLEPLQGSPKLIEALRESLADTEKASQKGGYSTLLNSTVLLDLAATSDSWPVLRSELLSNVSSKKGPGNETITSIDTLATMVPKFTGAAWDALQRFMASQRPRPAATTPRSGSDSAAVVSEDVLASVDSILPHYGVERLRTILSRPSFAGQNAETVIQRLLEGDEGEADTSASTSLPPQAESNVRAAPPQQPVSLPHAPVEAPPSSSSTPAPPSLVKSRANLFGDFGFDPASIVQPKLTRSGKVDELAPELKAAILARAEATDDDEAEEEWNPFAEAHRTVGVEDELDLDYDGREKGPAPRRTGHDEEEADEDDEGGAAVDHDQTRMRERELLRHYVQYGSGSFSTDAATRRSEARQRLKAQTGWSDDLIESWAVMLDRNPKKDRLLAAASQSELDEQLHSRDLGNASDADDDTDAQRRFGPDRGRGGRILRGGGRGGHNTGRGGNHHGSASGGGSGNGSGGSQTKNATRGRGTGNSNTDRFAKQKEKAGNKARQKGHDKKMARVNM